MSFPVQNTLSTISPQAEKALFAFPTWTAIDSESHAACTASVAAVAGFQHCVTYVDVSFSATLAGATQLQILDGATVLWQTQIAITTLQFARDFGQRPLHASANAALTATIGDGGAGIVGTVNLAGFSVKQP